MLLAKRWRWIEKVSPMSVLYAVGLLTANLTPWLHDERLLDLNNTISSVCIPLAIPLMLISCSLGSWQTGKAVKAFFSGLTAILAVSIAGFFLFKGNGDPRQFAQVCAVAVGIYTGGIPNMGAIAQGVGMDQETYLYVTSYDLIITGLYLIFVIFLGKPVFRRLLGKDGAAAHDKAASGQENASRTAPIVRYGLPVLITIAIAACSYLISTLLPDSISTPMLILILTTLSIAASFLPIVKRINKEGGDQPFSFQLGLYFVYVFCFAIANACDVRQMDLAGSLNILWYILFVVFGSLALQILFSKILRLDGDSTLAASVALINSPPFVPLVAALLDNKEVIILGITIGLLGYMLGNYLGLAIFFLFAPA